jgi:hypothetical protein
METSHDDEVHDLLAAIVSSLNNTLYDLSMESERNENKVTAKRLDYSRQKVMAAWEVYTKKRAEKDKEA